MTIQKFVLYCVTYAILGAYCLWIGLSYPLCGIEIEEKENRWVVTYIEYPDWAEQYNVQIGDYVLKINGQPIENQTQKYTYDPYIRKAHSIEFQKANGPAFLVPVYYEDLQFQWLLQWFVPFMCYLLTFATNIYLLRKKSNTTAIEYLISFLFVVSLAYVSSCASSRADMIGSMINAYTMVLNFLLLLKFIHHYFDYWGIRSPLPVRVKGLFILPWISLTVSIVQSIYPQIGHVDRILIMTLVILLVLYILILVGITYWQYRVQKLKILFIGLIAPFVPFLFLFFIPELLFGEYIVSSVICSILLLFIPLNVVLFHLTERLYDLQYYVSRFRYYFVISICFTLWVIGGFAFFVHLSINKLAMLALFTGSSTVLLFYIKEWLDYRHRKVLFSPHGNYMHQLYQTVQHLGSVYKIEEILRVLQQEVARHLEIHDTFVLTYDFDEKAFDGLASLPTLEVETLLQMTTGSILQTDRYYIAAIHEDSHYKRWLFMVHKQSIRLKQEELLWLELIVSYTSIFIENTKIIEELVEELQSLRQERLGEPLWMKKLLWFKIEQEKFKLAQDLHDSILQENISIARQFDFIMTDRKLAKTTPQLTQLHEQMLNSIQQLRTYCETLKPPLLYQMGIHVALERFAEKIQAKANFQLRTTFDRLYIENEQVLLSIYRIVQELLHNAVKHSKATNVEVSVLETEDGVEIYYTDDGIGCDVQVFNQSESFGMYGIQERVHALDGQISIESAANEGFTLQILIKERENNYDFSINHR